MTSAPDKGRHARQTGRDFAALSLRSSLLAICSLVAFAANSLLARAVLTDPANSPGAFATIRLSAGAIVLAGFAAAGRFSLVPRKRDLPAVLALFIYAFGFSLSYVSIGAGSGALILFAAVQVTIISIGITRGDRIGPVQGSGLLLALLGLGWLLFPGIAAPRPLSAIMMASAGVAWGVYSTVNSTDPYPVARTARNFAGAALLSLAMLAVSRFNLTPTGWQLAIVSGAVTSALGYVLWYALLPSISRLAAASLQLAVPLLAALGAALFLDEPLSLRLAGAGILIVSGIALTLRRRA